MFPDKSWAAGTGVFSIKTLTFALFVAALLAINLFGNRAVKWANGVSTVGKVLALSLFIAGGLVVVLTRHTNNYAASTAACSNPHQAALDTRHHCRAVRLHRFRIDRERRRRNGPSGPRLPKAIPLAVFSVGAIYVLAVVVAMMLGADKIPTSRATVQLAAAIGDDTFRTVIVLGALVSMFGINVAASFGAPPGCGPRCPTGASCRSGCRIRTGLACRCSLSGSPVVGAGLSPGAALRQREPHRPGGDRPVHPIHHRANRSHRAGARPKPRTRGSQAKCVHRQGAYRSSRLWSGLRWRCPSTTGPSS